METPDPKGRNRMSHNTLCRWLIVLIAFLASKAYGQKNENSVVDPKTANFFDVVYTNLERLPKAALCSSKHDCVIDINLTKKWGWNVTQRKGKTNVFRVVAGTQQADSVRSIAINGRTMLQFTDAVREFNGSIEWDSENNQQILYIRSRIQNVKINKGSLTISATMPVQVSSTKIMPQSGSGEPWKLAVDLRGASLDPYQCFSLPKGVRLAYNSASIVRLVIEGPAVEKFFIPEYQVSNTIAINVSALIVPESYTTNVTKLQRIDIGGTGTVSQRDDLLLSAELAGGILERCPSISYVSPKSMIIDFDTFDSNADIKKLQPTINSKFITSVAVNRIGQKTRLTLNLKNPLIYKANAVDGKVSIALAPPTTLGRLNGKTIIVDAGHGGTDIGAQSLAGNKVYEKDITLAVAKTLQRILEQKGVNVIMTRNNDVDVSKYQRLELYYRHPEAAFFISLHADDTGKGVRDRQTRTGQIVFFHKKDPAEMLLATCIKQELAQRNLLPPVQVKTDTDPENENNLSSGFVVLQIDRYATLIEMGYITNPNDTARMLSPDFQNQLSSAIVRGIQVFIHELDNT